MRAIAGAALALMLAGCVTAYEDAVSIQPLDQRTAIIEANATPETGGSTVYRYVMRAAAEHTLKTGNEWFELADQQDTSRRAFVANPYANAYSPVAVTEAISPGRRLVIRMGTGPTPPNGIDAKAALANLETSAR